MKIRTKNITINDIIMIFIALSINTTVTIDIT